MCIFSIYGYNVCLFAVFVDDDELDSGGMARSSFGRTPVSAAAAGGGGWVAVDADGGEREAAEAADPLRDADGSLRLHRRRRTCTAASRSCRRPPPPARARGAVAYYAYIDILLHINAYLMYGLAYIVNLHSLHKFYSTLLGLNTCQIANYIIFLNT